MSREWRNHEEKGAKENETKMGMITCLYLNIWPVSWSSPAAGAMRMYGVVSWVTIIAAKAKEDFQVSMHEGKKSQTEARPARRILVNSLLSELLINKKEKEKKTPTSSFSSSVAVSLVILQINELLYVTYRKRTQSTLFTYNVFEETGDCLALLVAALGFLSENYLPIQIFLILTSLCNF